MDCVFSLALLPPAPRPPDSSKALVPPPEAIVTVSVVTCFAICRCPFIYPHQCAADLLCARVAHPARHFPVRSGQGKIGLAVVVKLGGQPTVCWVTGIAVPGRNRIAELSSMGIRVT